MARLSKAKQQSRDAAKSALLRRLPPSPTKSVLKKKVSAFEKQIEEISQKWHKTRQIKDKYRKTVQRTTLKRLQREQGIKLTRKSFLDLNTQSKSRAAKRFDKERDEKLGISLFRIAFQISNSAANPTDVHELIVAVANELGYTACKRLGPEQTSALFGATSLPYKKQRTLRSQLSALKANPFASERAVRKHLRAVTSGIRFRSAVLNLANTLITVAFIDNVADVLQMRLDNLVRSGKFLELADGKIHLILMMDYGGGSTKLAVSIGNVNGPVNSVDNATLLALYNSDERYCRTILSDVAQEVNALRFLSVAGQPIAIRRFLVCDYKATKILCGITGENSVRFPCVFYLGPKERNHHTQSIYAAYALRDPDVHRDVAHGQENTRLFETDVRDVIVPYLHVFMGLAQDLLTLLENYALEYDIQHNAADVDIDEFTEIRTEIMQDRLKEVEFDEAYIESDAQ